MVNTVIFAVAILATSNSALASSTSQNIPYNFDPLKLRFYIVKLGFTGVYIIFSSPELKAPVRY